MAACKAPDPAPGALAGYLDGVNRNPKALRYPQRCLLAGLLVVSALMSGCGGDPFWLPNAHKITIQQGNLLNEAQLAQVEPGMTRDVVRGLLGAPVANTPFHDSRWDYLFTRGPAGVAITANRVSIFFDEGERVTRIDNNSAEESGRVPPQRRWWEYFTEPRDSNV